LKPKTVMTIPKSSFVAPCVGAWIETFVTDLSAIAVVCRALRGRVD